MNFNNVFRTISNFLFAKTYRELLIFLSFLILSGIFWLLMTLNENYEQEIKIPVRYTNIPKGAVLTSSETDTLRAIVSDKGISLITYLYKKAANPIEIDFMKFAGENGTGIVGSNELFKLVNNRLPASANAVSIKPEKLTFYYNYGEQKRVPVRLKGDVTPDKHYFISGTYFSPDSISIYASPRILDSIQEVFTEPVIYRDVHDSLSINCKLQKIKGVKMVPDQTTVSFSTDILTELSFEEVPVIGINMPEGKILRTFPAKVKVSFVAGLKKYQNMSSEDFIIVADYNDIIRDSTSNVCEIWFQKKPEGLNNLTLSTTKVEYLIEDK